MKLELTKFLANRIIRPLIKETLGNPEVQKALIDFALSYGKAALESKIKENQQ